MIQVNFDLSNSTHLQALKAVIAVFEEASQPVSDEAPKKPRKPRAKKPTGRKEEPKSNGADVTIEEIRKLAAERIADHKAAMRAKLAELGANRVPALDPAKYAEFKDFLISLT